jgi:hypothetical protein
VVNCTNFENWRGFAVTVGSNPSLSGYIQRVLLFAQIFIQTNKFIFISIYNTNIINTLNNNNNKSIIINQVMFFFNQLILFNINK